MMRFREIAARLTGVSLPGFGLSWHPSAPESEAARRIISFLEDRRVLFAPYEIEVPQHCVESVMEIRRFLTDEIGRLRSDSEFAASLRAMRVACRIFLEEGGVQRIQGSRSYGYGSEMNACFFGEALGRLRASVGLQIALIAARYEIDVEDDLAQILPAAERDSGENGYR